MLNLHGFTSHFSAGCPAFHPRGDPFIGGPSDYSRDSRAGQNPESPSFGIFEWYPAYQNCQQFFLDYAQHENGVQAIAALINICLPFQWPTNTTPNPTGLLSHPSGPAAYNAPWPSFGPMSSGRGQPAPVWVSLIPYIRRLIITGMDKESIMHCFFGDDWRKGVGPLYKCERRNYMFAVKSGGWAMVKGQYDISPHESAPFLMPLQGVQLAEIEGADEAWSQWLAMEDWMVGPRAPDVDAEARRNA